MRTLDVGCGNNPQDGCIGLDLLHYENCDVQGDATRIPFEDESFDKVISSQTLEHLSYEQIVSVFEEVWRILVPGGTFTFDVPAGETWKEDPTHETPWRFKTIVYFLTREEVERLGWDPEVFPDYNRDKNFSFELESRDADAWITSENLLLRALSVIVQRLSSYLTTDRWTGLPLASLNLKFELRKVIS